MEIEELRTEAEKFFEWPSDTKDHVTLTSALIFAQLMMQREREKIKRPAPCEKFCEQIAFNAEIKKLETAASNLAHALELAKAFIDIELYLDEANIRLSEYYTLRPHDMPSRT